MHANNERVALLANAVRLAFRDVAYPGDDEIQVEGSSDPHELENLRSQDWNSDWANVPDDAIEWHANSLAFLSPEAYRFYLPAFIIYTFGKA